MVGNVVRLTPNRHLYYPREPWFCVYLYQHQVNKMDTVDISNLVVGNPPTVFNPTYFTRPTPPKSEH